jgi:hypothetical protein
MSKLRWFAPLTLAGALLGAPGLSGSASAATGPVLCSGSGSFGPTAPPVVRSVGGETLVSFPFAGLHPYCPAPGGIADVTARIDGTLNEEITAQSHFDLYFAETMTLPDGSSDQWRGEASGKVATSGLLVVSVSEVRTVGTATGQPAGVVGNGTFKITGFGGYGFEFADEISYVYSS